MRNVIRFVLVVVLAIGAVGLSSSAGAEPGTGYGGGAKACKC